MNVLITGASKGIGYETARLFCREERIRLFLIARSEEKLLLLKNECLNINKRAEIEIMNFDLKELLNEKFKFNLSCDHLDILINNAGYLVNKEFSSLSNAEIFSMTETNFLAPAALIRSCLPFLGGKQKSHVLNIASMGGFQGSVKFNGLSIYSATKAALASLTECLAAEYAERNIFFNCLALGATQTEMLQEAFPGYKAPLNAAQMAEFVVDFACSGHKFMNGKIVPVSLSTP